LKSRPGFFILPAASLSIGVSIAMIAILFVTHEMSYDRFHADFNHIFEVSVKTSFNGDPFDANTTTYATGSRLMELDIGVSSVSRIVHPSKKTIISNPDKLDSKSIEPNFCFVDSNFLETFSFKMEYGDPKWVLQMPYSVVITPKMAIRYFGKKDPIGKYLALNNKYPLKITGIIEENPSNSSIRYDFLCPVSTFRFIQHVEKTENLNNDIALGEYETYVVLKAPSRAALIESSLKQMASANQIVRDSNMVFNLRPLRDLHHIEADAGSVSVTYTKAIPYVALAILMVSIFNYINLISTKFLDRTKEIGVKKVLGASTTQIAFQFFLESAMVTIFSVLFGIMLFFPLKTLFLNVINTHIDSGFLFDFRFLGALFTMVFLLVLATSIYPAFLASRFSPLRIMKRAGPTNNRTVRLIDLLVGFQFFICFSCILISLVHLKQINYLKDFSGGVSRNNVIVVPFDFTLGNNFKNVLAGISGINGVEKVSAAHYSLYTGYDEITFRNSMTNRKVSLPVYLVDQNFMGVLGIKYAQKPYGSLQLTEPLTILVNQTAIQKLGLNTNPLSQTVSLYSGEVFNVRGVIENFNYMSLKGKIEGLGLIIKPDTSSQWGTDIDGFYYIKANRNSEMHLLLHQMKMVYERYERKTPFTYEFLSNIYQAQYENEERLGKAFFYLTTAAILLSCFGLYSFIVFLVFASTRLVSIKKMLGASKLDILGSVMKKVFLAFLIAVISAVPLTTVFLVNWLDNYSFRIHLQFQYFVLAFLALLVISAATIGFELFKLLKLPALKGLR
jgi:putative ABC transport system permease protein